MFVPLILWALIFLLIFPFYVLSVIIFGLYRLLINFIVWKWKPDLVAHFTSRDLAFTSDDFRGKVRKSVINVTVVDGRLTLEALRTQLRQRLLAKPFFFKLHARPVLFMGYWFWQNTDLHVSHSFNHTSLRCSSY
jgi:hypothetical protein